MAPKKVTSSQVHPNREAGTCVGFWDASAKGLWLGFAPARALPVSDEEFRISPMGRLCVNLPERKEVLHFC